MQCVDFEIFHILKKFGLQENTNLSGFLLSHPLQDAWMFFCTDNVQRKQKG